jgi:periplasmic divalent cation tolerance protein
MTDKIVVLVTAGSGDEAERIARSLVEKRLAACVNVVNPIQSVYRWEGKVTRDAEVLLIIKTSRRLFEQVRHEVENIHSYHVPEVICLPIIDGSANYLNWLADSLELPSEGVKTFPASKKKKSRKSSKKKPKKKKR